MPADSYPYRMRDLVRLTATTAATIHFYAQQGLLPPARKTAGNQARYQEAAVGRVLWIRSLQHEQRPAADRALRGDPLGGILRGGRLLGREPRPVPRRRRAAGPRGAGADHRAGPASLRPDRAARPRARRPAPRQSAAGPAPPARP